MDNHKTSKKFLTAVLVLFSHAARMFLGSANLKRGI
jgi:hypothetical protein